MAGRGNERTGHLFLSGKNEAAHTELPLPVPCGWLRHAFLHVYIWFVEIWVGERVSEREVTSLKTHCERRRVKQALHCLFLLLHLTLSRLCQWWHVVKLRRCRHCVVCVIWCRSDWIEIKTNFKCTFEQFNLVKQQSNISWYTVQMSWALWMSFLYKIGNICSSILLKNANIKKKEKIIDNT